MKRPRLAFALLQSVLWALTATTVCGTPAELSPERLVLTPLAGDSEEMGELRIWQARARRPDAIAADFERLGWAFIALARRTLDEGSYGLALAAAEAATSRFGASPGIQLLRGHALHNLHRFEEAEAVARDLVAERGAARDYALLGDVLLERGDLEGSVSATQMFVNRLPGFEAFARVAHLRWLHGDTAGAIAAMREAIRAGDVRAMEPQAWALTRLANLYLADARPTAALDAANQALDRMPGYPPALLALGRARLALGTGAEAVEALRSAAEANPLPEYQWWLADALKQSGAGEEAAKVIDEIVSHGPQSDPRTASLFLSTAGIEPDEALRLASAEFAHRKDVHTEDALAWALYRNGRIQESVPHARAALRTGIADARILLHAGIILGASGLEEDQARLLEKARVLDASLTPSERTLLSASFASPVVPGTPDSF